MPTTYKAIQTVTVGSGGSTSIDFTTIPNTYTDLLIKISLRNNNTGLRVRFNSDTGTNYSWRRLYGDSASVYSDNQATFGSPYNTFLYFSMQNSTTTTANTFSNGELYLPNYASSTQNKSAILDSVAENNGSVAYMAMQIGYYAVTTTISSISLAPDVSSSASIAQYSTATLYGIKNT